VEYFAPAELTVAVDIDAGAYADYLYNATTLQALCSAALQADNSSNRLGGTCVSIHVYVCVCIHVYVCMYVKYVCKYMYVCMCVCVWGGGDIGVGVVVGVGVHFPHNYLPIRFGYVDMI
jgi:hypothetical protein